MIQTNSQHLLMIEPSSPPTAVPVLDSLTLRMCAAWRKAVGGRTYRGSHSCTGAGCKIVSDNQDHFVFGRITHSLCVHYLAHHRSDIDTATLIELDQFLPLEEADPNVEELGIASFWHESCFR
jgi:hypothetical protein